MEHYKGTALYFVLGVIYFIVNYIDEILYKLQSTVILTHSMFNQNSAVKE